MTRVAAAKVNIRALTVLVMLACCAWGQQPATPTAPSGPAEAANPASAAGQNGQSLPNAPSATLAQQSARKVNLNPTLAEPFAPLTPHEKLHLWFDRTYSPYTFSSVLFSATWAQMTGAWPSYGGGMQGFGKRFGASLANTEAAGFFKAFALPTLLHQDPRYFAKREGGVFARAAYAATRVIFTRNDYNRVTFNTSEVLGDLFIRGLNNAYYPSADRGFTQTLNGTVGAILSDAGSNVLREFSPDIWRLFHKHEPESVKRIEERIPKSVQRITGTMPPEENQPPEAGKPPEQNKELEQDKESKHDSE